MFYDCCNVTFHEFKLLFLGDAKNAFNNLKKRYSKKRNDLKRAKRSGAGLADVQKFEKAFEVYSFLGWLNNFLQLKDDTMTNLTTENIDYENEASEEEDEDDNEAKKNYAFVPESDGEETSRVKTNKRPSFSKSDKPQFKKKRNESKFFQEENETTEILQTINKRLQEKSEQPQKRDEDDVFGEMVSSEIKKLPKLLKVSFKHEVSNLIFKYQMISLQDSGTDLFKQQSRSYSSPATSPMLSPIQPDPPCPAQNSNDELSSSTASSNQSTYHQSNRKSFRVAADIGNSYSYHDTQGATNNLWN